MASSSSSVAAATSSQLAQRKYDVFLSFRGIDTRTTFTSHLYEGLKNNGIFTFLDDKRMEGGDLISEELSKAIQESQVAIVVFSKNYATSRWCLNELVMIMECKDKNEKIVIPIFHDVEPSHVRHQSESFAEAFVEHDFTFKDDANGMQRVQGWRNALTAAANLKGHDIRNRDETDCIRNIVAEVSSKLCKTLVAPSKNIVGINTHLEKVEFLLKTKMFVGIWGMGGIGKTTIANALFDKLSCQFEAACFIGDIKENEKSEVHKLQKVLLSKLLGDKDVQVDSKEEGKKLMASRLHSKKVLVVVDDIDHIYHLDNLVGNLNWYGKGSRIIATTRDKHLIKQMKDAILYEVTKLPNDDAIQLFNQHAFKEEVPDKSFAELSLEVVDHANGLPLALKVWGSFLHTRDKAQWISAIEKMRTSSNLEVVEQLKISYDGLDNIQQNIFLDIACVFRGRRKDETMPILENCYPGVVVELSVLIEKSLVFISTDEYGMNHIEMHDLIQDMGRYVVKTQKGSRGLSRIWNVEDFEETMNNKESIGVEAIWLTNLKQLTSFNKEAIKNMTRLRILRIHFEFWDGRDSSLYDDSICPIEYLPNNLRLFSLHYYPCKSLPKAFKPKNLVHLDLWQSSLHYLWNGSQVQLPCLRWLNLSDSVMLTETPDFREMLNLEGLNLSWCKSLKEVHPSLGNCKKLRRLDLGFCKSLVRFACVNVESLEYLNLCFCTCLKKFPEIIGIMKRELKINMEDAGSELHKNIGLVIDVSGCTKLESLPENIGDLENLERLTAINTPIRPPSSIVRLNKLKFLDFSLSYSTAFPQYYPGSFVFPQLNGGLRSLEILDLSNCNLIDGALPEDIGCLSSLKKLNLSGNNFEHLPQSITQLGALQSLDLSDCKRLKELPRSMRMPNLEKLDLSNCNLIDGALPEDIRCLSSLKELNLSGNNFEHLPRSIAQLGALQILDLSFCERLKELPEFPEHLDRIEADWSNDWICNSLYQNISSLQHDISASDSFSPTVFTSWEDIDSRKYKIPSWFHLSRRKKGTSVSVSLPENWYISDSFLGFAVCYYGELTDITAHLIPLRDDGMSSMTQKLALSKQSHIPEFSSLLHFLLIPLSGLWDASKSNGKTPNDYGCIQFSFCYEMEFGCRLLYKDEAAEHHDVARSSSRNDEPTKRRIGTRCSTSCRRIQ